MTAGVVERIRRDAPARCRHLSPLARCSLLSHLSEISSLPAFMHVVERRELSAGLSAPHHPKLKSTRYTSSKKGRK